MGRRLVRVTGPSFCCGLVIGRAVPNGPILVLEAAPYLRKLTLGKEWCGFGQRVQFELLKRGYTVEVMRMPKVEAR